MLSTIKMNIFDAPKGSMLVHSCNAHGVWGSGIAAEFKKRFPKAFARYSGFCASETKTLGKAFIAQDNDYEIGCLITSKDYGRKVDKPERIVNSTDTALGQLFSVLERAPVPVYSNKFNSGLFHVPWELSERILLAYCNENPHIQWTVCDYGK